MKFLKTGALALAVAILLSLLASVVAQARISPAMSVLASDLEMTKSGLVNNNITFSPEDFDIAVGISNVSSITIITLPSPNAGVMMFGDVPVEVHQVIRRMDIERMVFVPVADQIYSCSFIYGVVGSNQQFRIRCTIHILDELNFAPTVAVPNEVINNPFDITTYANVTHFGTLHAVDPEDDCLRFEIVSHPRRGVLLMTNAATGDFMFVPARGVTGRDSFRYQVIDRYGNRSDVATVNVRINRPSSEIVYSDMNGHRAHNAAITLAAQNIMTGTTVAGRSVFNPDAQISRAEFLSIAMKAAGVEYSVEHCALEVFYDSYAIPVHLRGFIAAAVDGEIVVIHEVQTTFLPDSPITRAEAALVISRMIDTGELPSVPVFADEYYVPYWSSQAMRDMRAAGVIGTIDGNIMPTEYLTRGMAAEIAVALMNFR